MSNADRVREIYEAFNAGGIEAIIDYLHPDIEGWVSPELSPEPDTYRGLEGVRRWFAGFEGSIDDVRMEPADFVEDGERVLVPFSLRGRGAGTGIEVTQEAVQAWTFRDGKVARVDGYPDMESAREGSR